MYQKTKKNDRKVEKIDINDNYEYPVRTKKTLPREKLYKETTYIRKREVVIDDNLSSSDKVNKIELVKNETYYFDANGNMLTGFVVTPNNKTYLFEYQPNLKEGAMVFGWKQVGNDWYYFALDGVMLLNAYTSDGYKVGIDGKWVQ